MVRSGELTCRHSSDTKLGAHKVKAVQPLDWSAPPRMRWSSLRICATSLQVVDRRPIRTGVEFDTADPAKGGDIDLGWRHVICRLKQSRSCLPTTSSLVKSSDRIILLPSVRVTVSSRFDLPLILPMRSKLDESFNAPSSLDFMADWLPDLSRCTCLTTVVQPRNYTLMLKKISEMDPHSH